MEIKQLKTDVIDKIAAGEVVERPSHLLKELLENSLDAAADRIEIDVDEGGKTLCVLDNGRGVLPAEIPLVFARHATSKILEAEDLWKLDTFGFRGEAVASISAVSQLDFTSRHEGEEQAFRVKSEFGQLTPIMEASLPVGTRVQVTGLFNNIPARLKFLKSDSAELTQIKNVVKAMALQHPHVEWKLKSKGKLVFIFPKTDSLLERAKVVLETDRLFQSDFKFEDFHATVIFSDPSQVVKVSRQIWIFVQNRWVQDKGLQAAVMEAYRSLLMHGQYPIAVVSLQCPADQVDVNIHPTKSQVKFLDSKKAFRAVYHGLREAIEKAPWQKSTPKAERTFNAIEENQNFSDSAFEKVHFKQKSQSLRQETKPFVNGPRITLQDWKNEALEREGLSSRADCQSHKEFQFKSETSPLESRGFSIFSEAEPATSSSYWSQLQVIGQLDLTYIIAQDKDRFVLVDQHAAHERVAFERLMRDWNLGQVPIQSLLIPLVLDLDSDEVETLLGMSPDLQKMGIEIEQAGPESVAISSLPSYIKESGLVEALKKIAREVIEQGGSFAMEKTLTDIFATMACHSVVRAGQALSLQEMNQLLKDMDEFPLSGFCPHGRSVSLEFTFARLEKDFGRRG